MSNNFYNNIYLFDQKVSKFLGQPESTIRSQILEESFAKMPLMRSWMQKYEARLPRTLDNTQKAKQLLDDNTFSQQEVDTAFQLLEKERLRIIDKQVNRFRRYFDEHAEFRWDKKHDAKTDAILAKQNELNGELSQKIDRSEYSFFHNNDRVVYYGESSVPHNIYGNDSDIPF